MFAQELSRARKDAGLSVARLAALSGTSRSAISSYEAGTRSPQVNTAERILSFLGTSLTTAKIDRFGQHHIDNDALEAVIAAQTDPDTALAHARQNIAAAIDSDLGLERLDVTWGRVLTASQGITVDGASYDIWRLGDLVSHFWMVWHDVARGRRPLLRLVADDGTLVEADQSLAVPASALEFLVRAAHHGGDDARMRHLVGGYLSYHGYPWLWVPYKLHDPYRQAGVVNQRVMDGSDMVRILAQSIEES